MDWQVDEDQGGPAALEALDRRLPAVVGAVVDDPEHPPRGGVGLFGHDLPDEPVERGDAALSLAAPDHLAAAYLPGVEVGERAHALVLVLDELAMATRTGGLALMDSPAGLDRGLRIRTDHHVAGLQQLSLEAALVEVEHPAGLLEEVGVARKDPRTVLPGLDRVL